MLKTCSAATRTAQLADFIRGSVILHNNNSKRASAAAKA
jgi:hypothetical protein